MEGNKRKELCEKIYNMARKKMPFIEICRKLELQDYEVVGLITIMHEEGYNIEFVNGEVVVLKTPKKQEATEKENKKVVEIVEKMNKELKKVDTSIEFKVHETDGIGQNKVSIKVVEKDSEKVIAEIPSEEAIEFAEKMEEITGLLFDHSM